MDHRSNFFLKLLVPDANWNYQKEPTKGTAKYFVNDKPVIGIADNVFEYYQDIDYIIFSELKKNFPNTSGYYYQGVRFIEYPEFKVEEVEGVFVTYERTIDQTIVHLISEDKDQDKLDSFLKDLKERYPDYYIGTIYQTIEGRLFEILYQKKLKICFAESCTGGLMVSRLINCKGASEVIGRSFVTYSNASKNEILGVDPKLIKKFGVVSAEVAEAMAEGLAKISKADVNVSVTGYAGGDQPNPDDGLCYFACSYNGFINIERLQFEGDRNQVRLKMASYILWRVGQLLILKP